MAIVVADHVRGIAKRIVQDDAFAAKCEVARVVSDDVRDTGKRSGERGAVVGHDQVLARAQDGVGWELKPDPIVERPSGKVDGARPPIVQLDPAFIRLGKGIVGRLVMVHDFVDHDIRGQGDDIGGSRRSGGRSQPFVHSIGIAAARAILHDRGIPDGSGTVVQEQLVLVIRSEPERRFVKDQKSTTRNRLGRQRVFPRIEPGADNAIAANGDIRWSGIVQFHPECCAGCSRNLVEDDSWSCGW